MHSAKSAAGEDGEMRKTMMHERMIMLYGCRHARGIRRGVDAWKKWIGQTNSSTVGRMALRTVFGISMA
jgi:hypothetical protein